MPITADVKTAKLMYLQWSKLLLAQLLEVKSSRCASKGLLASWCFRTKKVSKVTMKRTKTRFCGCCKRVCKKIVAQVQVAT